VGGDSRLRGNDARECGKDSKDGKDYKDERTSIRDVIPAKAGISYTNHKLKHTEIFSPDNET